MALIRRLARPMLAATFIYGGIDTLRNPGPKAKLAEGTVGPLVNAIPQLTSAEQVVKLDAAVKVVAGTSLALGRFPRLSALALIGSMIPTTASGHRFWEKTDPVERRQQLLHFLKNTSMVGGLMLAAVDTAGKPSLAWRAQHAPHQLSHAAGDLRRDAELALHDTVSALQDASGTVRDKLPI